MEFLLSFHLPVDSGDRPQVSRFMFSAPLPIELAILLAAMNGVLLIVFSFKNVAYSGV